jgi:pyrroline-5-carboxylate reductase
MSSNRTELAFVGAGKMAGAIVRGLVEGGAVPPAKLACMGGPNDGSAANLARATGIRLAADVVDLLDGADAVLLACKPQQFKTLDPRLPALVAGKLVISILAGFSVARLAVEFPLARGVVAVMPNTPAQVRSGVSVWTASEALSSGDAALVEKYLGSVGRVVRGTTGQMDAVCGVSGSGPGFFFEIVAAFEAAAIRAGLPEDMAQLLVRQTFAGSARLLLESGESPEALRDAVTSPGGTTLAGLRVFEKRALRETFAEVVAAAAARSAELGKA